MPATYMLPPLPCPCLVVTKGVWQVAQLQCWPYIPEDTYKCQKNEEFPSWAGVRAQRYLVVRRPQTMVCSTFRA